MTKQLGKDIKVTKGTVLYVKGKLTIESMDALQRLGFTVIYK